ncbi:hypothetical protein DBR43_15645 [Pedobacter sp. KBW06]|nr:hypothetical protein DBR43_15645 [Pedobacter sp. KBW06]
MSCSSEKHAVMGLKFYEPDSLLKDYVKKIIITELDSASSDLKEMNLVPDCYQYLCFILVGKPEFFEQGEYVRRPDAVFTGLHTMPTSILMDGNCCIVNVQFKPFGLYSFFNVPQEEMINRCVDAKTFIGSSINLLMERLAEAASAESQNQIIQGYLKERLKASRFLLPVDHALNLMIEQGGNQTIEDTAALSCLSLKQFERVCKLRLGISPKSFGKLVRFSNLYKLREKHPELPWSQLANHCGYFDQMHMIRDFKQFTGGNPKFITRDDVFRSFPFEKY